MQKLYLFKNYVTLKNTDTDMGLINGIFFISDLVSLAMLH